MQIELQTLEKSEVKLRIKFTPEDLQPYEVKAAEELQSQVKVDGFRQGHIPLDVLKERVGEQAFLGAVLDVAVGDSYEKAIHEKNLRPVAYPKIALISQEPLEYEATVAVVPEVSFKKDLSTIQVKRQIVSVDEKEVHEVIENFLQRSKKWEDVDRAAAKEDRVELDFDGFDESGVPLEGTSSKNHPVVIGSNSLIPGFEDEIIGMKKGEKKDFWITFPKDYHSKAFQSKKVKFSIQLNRIEEGKKNEASDDWAREVSGDPKKDLAGMKEDIKTELQKQKEMQEDARLEESFLKALIDHVKAEVPDALVEREIDFMVDRLKQDLERQKQSMEDYEKKLKEEGKDLRKELYKPALEQVLVRLGLEKCFEMENPEVTEEEVEAEVDRLLTQYPPELKTMMKPRYSKGGEGHQSVWSMARLKKLVQNHTEK